MKETLQGPTRDPCGGLLVSTWNNCGNEYLQSGYHMTGPVTNAQQTREDGTVVTIPFER